MSGRGTRTCRVDIAVHKECASQDHKLCLRPWARVTGRHWAQAGSQRMWAAGRAGAGAAAADQVPGHALVQLQRQRDVGQRPQRQHADLPGARSHLLHQPLRRAHPHRPALRLHAGARRGSARFAAFRSPYAESGAQLGPRTSTAAWLVFPKPSVPCTKSAICCLVKPFSDVVAPSATGTCCLGRHQAQAEVHPVLCPPTASAAPLGSQRG
jgi:hypothetical protein